MNPNQQGNTFDSLYDEHEPSDPIENDESRLHLKRFQEFRSNMTELELTKGSFKIY